MTIDIPAGTAKDHARDKQPAVAYAVLYQRLVRVRRQYAEARRLVQEAVR